MAKFRNKTKRNNRNNLIMKQLTEAEFFALIKKQNETFINYLLNLQDEQHN